MAGEIAPVSAWAKRHHVAVFCGEFGVYRAYSPPAARQRWLHDMTSVLRENHIGWSMWDYSGGDFSLVKRNAAGTPILHPHTAAGLGLKLPRR